MGRKIQTKDGRWLRFQGRSTESASEDVDQGQDYPAFAILGQRRHRQNNTGQTVVQRTGRQRLRHFRNKR